MTVAFLGLGAMGLPMALNLLRAGFSLSVYNRTAGRTAELAAEGARAAGSIAGAVRDARIVVTMLADDAAVLEAAGALLESLPPSAVHLGMSTIGVGSARRLTEMHAAAGIGYVSAPVFGRPDAAAAQRLWVVAAGPPAQIESCRPTMVAVSRAVSVVGSEPWVANAVKVSGNMLIAAVIEALGEAFALQRKCGVDPHAFLEIVNGALFQSPLYANYGGIIADERYDPPGFKLVLGLKDVRLALEAADLTGAPLPLASLLHDHLLAAVANGKGGLDWAALGLAAAERAGLSPR